MTSRLVSYKTLPMIDARAVPRLQALSLAQGLCVSEVVQEETPEEIRANLRPKRRRWIWIVLALVVVAIIAAVVIKQRSGKEEQGPKWETATVTRGDIALRATATGTLEPRRKVIVGAEISGQLVSVDADANDKVTAGQVLATLDTVTIDNELAQSRAGLAGSRANLKRADATLEEARIYEKRVKELLSRDGIAKSEADTARARTLRAEADVESARADIRRAQAAIRIIEARREKAVIRAPIDGVILSRAIEPGNTLTSALQTPELFVIAEDLARMELQVLINESDVGLVTPGQTGSFTVDTWADEKFEATVETVSLSPTKVGEVVTYMTTLVVNNEKGLLRPGMTASVTIETGKREGVLRVPAKALWFKPPEEKGGFQFGRPRREDVRERGSAVHLLAGDKPERLVLQLGRSDGDFVEVRDGSLKEGDVVITGQKEDKKKDDSSKDGEEGA